ncbi:efflux RND transporter periplasmic adaptor subunit [Comamonadaceae bacterium M7527]|nr:efflux RND transporter periplasmic adaptor subunit [Comamonadaceae bacterium M7527]
MQKPLVTARLSNAAARAYASSRRQRASVGLACLLVLGGAVYLSTTPVQSQEAANSAQALPPTVAISTFEEVLVHPSLAAAAQVQARNTAQLAAQVGGVVQSWHADAGATVKRGEVLAQLDPQDLRLALAQAQAAYASATAQAALSAQQLKRAQDLVAQGFLSPQALQQRETEQSVTKAQVAGAAAALQTARRALSKTAITAPFNGVVLQRMAQVGDMVAAGTPLFQLVDNAKPEVALSVSATQAISLKRAATATWRAKDTSQDYAVKVLRIGASLDQRTRAQPARLSFSGQDVPLPGSAGELMWKDPQAHLPTHVLVRRNGQVGYFTVANNKAQFVAIDRAQEGRPAAIDLPPNAPIVTTGQALLQNGQTVQLSQ